jgi:hypothetical protein
MHNYSIYSHDLIIVHQEDTTHIVSLSVAHCATLIFDWFLLLETLVFQFM